MTLQLGLFTTVPSIEESPRADLERAVEEVRIAESLGYGSAWIAETPFSRHARCPDAFTFAGHLAGTTTRIRIGTAVVLLPLHQPWAVVQRATLVQALSGGRLDLGVGRGFDLAAYRSAGIDPETRDDRFQSHLDEVLAGLRAQAVDDDVPRTDAVPSPPLWMAVTSGHRSLELAVTRGTHLLLGGPLANICRNLAEYRRLRDEHGIHVAPRLGVARAVCIDDDAELARRIADRAYVLELAKKPSRGLSEAERAALIDDLTIAGNAEQVADRIGQVVERTGTGLLLAETSFGDIPAERLASMHALAESVLPKLGVEPRCTDDLGSAPLRVDTRPERHDLPPATIQPPRGRPEGALYASAGA